MHTNSITKLAASISGTVSGSMPAALGAPAGAPITMSSREIAELTGKLHTHVLRDIRTMLDDLEEDQTKFGSVYLAGNGESRPMFNLPHRETMILLTGYSVPMRAKVVDRWRELEAQVVAPAVPTTFSAALRLAAETQERLELAEAQALQFKNHLALVAPKAEALDAFCHDAKRTIEAVLRDEKAFPGVKTTGVKTKLLGVHLYQRAEEWRVYRNGRSDKFFFEGRNRATGMCDIFCSDLGKAELLRLYRAGLFEMKKGRTTTA